MYTDRFPRGRARTLPRFRQVRSISATTWGLLIRKRRRRRSDIQPPSATFSGNQRNIANLVDVNCEESADFMLSIVIGMVVENTLLSKIGCNGRRSIFHRGSIVWIPSPVFLTSRWVSMPSLVLIPAIRRANPERIAARFELAESELCEAYLSASIIFIVPPERNVFLVFLRSPRRRHAP